MTRAVLLEPLAALCPPWALCALPCHREALPRLCFQQVSWHLQGADFGSPERTAASLPRLRLAQPSPCHIALTLPLPVTAAAVCVACCTWMPARATPEAGPWCSWFSAHITVCKDLGSGPQSLPVGVLASVMVRWYCSVYHSFPLSFSWSCQMRSWRRSDCQFILHVPVASAPEAW